METLKPKTTYPVLERAFSSAPEEFALLRSAYSAEELKQHEQRLATDSWDARFLPSLIKEAKERTASKVE